MTTTPPEPRFRTLKPKECEAVLARNVVGRVAFMQGHRVDIVPIHYVFTKGVVFGRTAAGTRLGKAGEALPSWPVAFEVDEVEALFRWRSVVVHGNLRAAAHGDAEWERSTPDWEEALEALRSLIPAALTASDPVWFRDVLLRLDPAEISGREASDPSAS